MRSRQVDFACYWFRLAHETIGENGRAGLVATNSVSQWKSRSVSLDYISQNGGYIHDAVTTQIWSGEAAVHVSVINWSKQKLEYFYLDNEHVNIINPSLRSTVNCSDSIRLKSNLNKGFVGIQPNGRGFYIDESISLK